MGTTRRRGGLVFCASDLSACHGRDVYGYEQRAVQSSRGDPQDERIKGQDY